MALIAYFIANFSNGETITEKEMDWPKLQEQKDLKEITAIQFKHTDKSSLATLQVPPNHLGLFYFKSAIAPKIVHCDVCRWKETDEKGNHLATERCTNCTIFYRADKSVLKYALGQFEDEENCIECGRKLVDGKCQYDGFTLQKKPVNEKVSDLRIKISSLEQSNPQSSELTTLKNILGKYDQDPEYPSKIKSELRVFDSLPNSFLPVQNYEVRKTVGYVKNEKGDCQCLMLDARTGFFKIYEDNVFSMSLNLGLFKIDGSVKK